MLLLHIACATVGFGAVVFDGLYRARARQHGGNAPLMLLEENGYVSRIAEFLIYAAFGFGLLVAVTSQNNWALGQSWLSLAMLLYIVELGLLHGIIHRAERHYQALLGRVDADSPGERSPEIAELEQLEQRIRLGWAAFDVIFLIILYLMVFTPGRPRVG
jgi:uncharacterized membrane protein